MASAAGPASAPPERQPLAAPAPAAGLHRRGRGRDSRRWDRPERPDLRDDRDGHVPGHRQATIATLERCATSASGSRWTTSGPATRRLPTCAASRSTAQDRPRAHRRPAPNPDRPRGVGLRPRHRRAGPLARPADRRRGHRDARASCVSCAGWAATSVQGYLFGRPAAGRRTIGDAAASALPRRSPSARTARTRSALKASSPATAVRGRPGPRPGPGGLTAPRVRPRRSPDSSQMTAPRPHHRRQDLGRPRRHPGPGRARRPRGRPPPRPRGHQPAGVHRAARARPRRPPPGPDRRDRRPLDPDDRPQPADSRPAWPPPRSASSRPTAPSSASRSTASATRARASSTSSARSSA